MDLFPFPIKLCLEEQKQNKKKKVGRVEIEIKYHQVPKEIDRRLVKLFTKYKALHPLVQASYSKKIKVQPVVCPINGN